MKKITNLLLILFCVNTACTQSKFEYPESRKMDVEDNYFGTRVNDSYRWLENDTAAEVAEWVKAQNQVTFGYLEKIPFRANIKERLTEIWNYERFTTPYKEGGKYFFSRNNGLQNQDVIMMTTDLKAEAKVILDPNALSPDGTVAISDFSVSPDGKYAAYGISRGGSDWVEVYVKDLATGNDIGDKLEWVKFSEIAWATEGFYYSRYAKPEDGKELSNQNAFQMVYFHKLNTPQDQDVLIYRNPNNPSRMYNAWVNHEKTWLVLFESEWSSKGNAIWVQDLRKPGSDMLCILKGFEYDYGVIDIVGDKAYIITNQGAPRNKLMVIDLKNPTLAPKDILPEKDNVLESCRLAGGKLLALYMKDVKNVLEAYDLSGKFLKNIELPAIGTIESLSASAKEPLAFFSFTSFAFPSTIYKLDLISLTTELWFSPKVDFKSEDYQIEQVFYPSKDGTKVPMFLVSKKGIQRDGSNPTLLYGYGGFNITQKPFFRASRMAWLEKGGVFALANIRGGGEYGEEWHQAGTKLNKQNVFDDFIAAAEYLIQEKYTQPARLAIQGGSNGGLLVGAVINQRPDLFRVALPAVGVMDMLRFQKFTIGAAWVADYGSSDDSAQFHYIFAYSPLHNIRSGLNYPAVLVTTADHDDRVVPAHSFKYIATLQEKYKGDNPVMIRIQTQAGHGAGKPTTVAIDEAADLFAFTLFNMGYTSY